MSERQEERTDRAILAAVEMLEVGSAEAPSAEEMRPWVELLGWLPSELEPVEPPAGVKEALMRDVRGRATGDNVSSFTPVAAESKSSSSALAWLYRIAAILAVVLLGVSVKQAADLGDSERRLTRQAARIEELQRLMAEFEAPQGAPEWMAASGTELCALRPREAASEESKGWLFVRQDHQHWYVAVEGLAAAPEGHVYELWFHADGEPVSGGTFQPGPDGRVTLTSETMPTGITGIAITLEPQDGDSAPSDAMVLYGDEVMLTL